MNGKGFLVFVLAIVLALGVAAVGIGAYQAGLAAGIAQGGGTVVAPYPPAYGWQPFGFGFGLFGFLGMLVFFVLLFGILRAIVFSGRGRGWGGPGRWDREHDHGRWTSREEQFDDWHRRRHDRLPGEGGTGSAAGAPDA
jgi:hypothetical protein